MKIVFEMQDCSRCGGSGKMPFALYGGQCFKCLGTGQTMTAKGRRAYKRLLEVQAEVCTVAASQLKPGDRIINSDRRTVTVVEVKVKLGKGNGGGSKGVKGSDSYMEYVNFGETVIRTKSGVGSAGPAHRAVTKAWTTETLTIAAEALKNFKGATIIANEEKVAA